MPSSKSFLFHCCIGTLQQPYSSCGWPQLLNCILTASAPTVNSHADASAAASCMIKKAYRGTATAKAQQVLSATSASKAGLTLLRCCCCCCHAISSAAGATDPVSRAMLQTEPELGQAAAAAAPAGKPYTEGSSWQVILGPVGAASNPPSGGISYTEFGGPDGIFTSSFNIFIQGFYVNDKNESTGTWYCSSVVNEKPAALTSLVRPTFAGQRLDTVTVVKQLSTSQAMTCMSGPENPKCTAQLKVRGKAKCLVNNKGVSQTCIRDEETLKSTARSASCEANTTASSVMVVADCGGKRWEVAPTQLLWGRTIVDPKP